MNTTANQNHEDKIIPIVCPAGSCSHIAGASLVVQSDKVSPQIKSDLLYAVYLAQLAANKKLEETKADLPEWYNHYRNILENLGFNLTELSFNQLEVSSNKVNIIKTASEAVAKSASPAKESIIKDLEAVNGLADHDIRHAIFDYFAQKEEGGCLQIISSSPDKGGAVVELMCIYFVIKTLTEHVLDKEYTKQDISIFAGNQTMLFDEAAYSKTREAIINKVGANPSIIQLS